MGIKITHKNYDKIFTVAEAVKIKLYETDYYSGEIESIKDCNNNTTRMLGELIQMLVDIGILKAGNVDELLGYRYKVEN